MINPDITDPSWIAERKIHFAKYSKSLKSEFSREQIACLESMWFEVEFDYGNENKYGEFSDWIGEAMRTCPIQTVERWDKWFLEDIPSWITKEHHLLQEVRRLILGHSGWKSPDIRENLGWDLKTELAVFHYYFGDRYQPGSFTFKHYEFDQHPLKPTEFGGGWVNVIRRWLSGYEPEVENKYTHLMDYGLSCLPYIHPFVLAYDVQIPAKLCANFIPEEAFERGITYHKEFNEDYQVEDNGERQKFLGEFQEKFLKLDLDPAVFECWEKCQEPGYEIVEELEDFYDHMPERLHIYDSDDQAEWENNKFQEALKVRGL